MLRSIPISVLFCSFSSLLLCSTFAQEASKEEEAPPAPNVIIILSDDQAWTDYGFMGHPEIKTPNLDALAGNSVVFEKGYVPSPLCRPSLASIMTGLDPDDHQIVANDLRPSTPADRHQENQALYQAFQKLPNIAKSLSKAGYATKQTGKWWEGNPLDCGFTNAMTTGDPEQGARHGDVGLEIGRRGMEPALEFINDCVEKDQRFFLWYAPFLPHTPHNPPNELVEKYKKPDRPSDVTNYYAMVEWFDQTCGELLTHLTKKNIRKDTLVLYVCDNGWTARSQSSLQPLDKGWTLPFAPRSKGTPYEAGVRTPIMVSWLGVLEPSRAPNFASSLDLFPTILEACQIDAPADSKLPGISLFDTVFAEEDAAILNNPTGAGCFAFGIGPALERRAVEEWRPLTLLLG